MKRKGFEHLKIIIPTNDEYVDKKDSVIYIPFLGEINLSNDNDK